MRKSRYTDHGITLGSNASKRFGEAYAIDREGE
jgi:hypothetical protein